MNLRLILLQPVRRRRFAMNYAPKSSRIVVSFRQDSAGLEWDYECARRVCNSGDSRGDAFAGAFASEGTVSTDQCGQFTETDWRGSTDVGAGQWRPVATPICFSELTALIR